MARDKPPSLERTLFCLAGGDSHFSILATIISSCITPHLLEQIRGRLLVKKLSPQTVLHYMKFLRHILDKAIKNGYLEINPFTKIDLVKVPKGTHRFSFSNRKTILLDLIGTHLWPLGKAGHSDRTSVGWRDAAEMVLDKLWTGLYYTSTTKTWGVQYVHLNTESQTILRTIQIQQINQGICGHLVFLSKTRASHLDQRNFYSKIFVPAVKAVGLQDVTWHTLRHTFASRLAMAKISEGTLAELLRHSSTDLVKRYAHLSKDHLRERWRDCQSMDKREKNSQSRMKPWQKPEKWMN